MYSKVFIVIDALDELCEMLERSIFLREIFKIQANTDASLFVTSRIVPEISHKFKKWVSLEIRASEEDVSRFLIGSMSQLPSFVQSNPDLQEDIRKAILGAVDGMFVDSCIIYHGMGTNVR